MRCILYMGFSGGCVFMRMLAVWRTHKNPGSPLLSYVAFYMHGVHVRCIMLLYAHGNITE